ncbi:MAG: M15 family metallopeptidase [Lactococcus garvieae]
MKECRDIEKLHPYVREKVKELQGICAEKNIKLGISETYRTEERQDYLYAQGRTRPGNIVTNAKGAERQSYHQWGLAVDIFQNLKGSEYERSFLKTVGEIAESIGFEWGGRWVGFQDTPHLQMTFGLSIQDLNAGEKIEEAKAYQDAVKQTADEIQYLEALNKLSRHGVISDTAFWAKPDQAQAKHVKSLVIKMAMALG